MADDERCVFKASGVHIVAELYGKAGHNQVPLADHSDLVATSKRLVIQPKKGASYALAIDSIYNIELQRSSRGKDRSQIVLHLLDLSASDSCQSLKAWKPKSDLSQCGIASLSLTFVRPTSADVYTSMVGQLTSLVEASSVKEDKADAVAPLESSKAGISGIERKIKTKQADTNRVVEDAMADLDRLIEVAKPMVDLATTVAQKIRDRSESGLSEDAADIVRFQSYLLGMGIDNPVTNIPDSPIELYTFPESNVSVLRLKPTDQSEGELALASQTKSMFSELMLIWSAECENHVKPSYQAFHVEPHEWAQHFGISVLVAEERLRSATAHGLLAVDISVQGYHFYDNKIISI